MHTNCRQPQCLIMFTGVFTDSGRYVTILSVSFGQFITMMLLRYSRNIPPFKEPEGLLPYPQESSFIMPYPELYYFIPCFDILLLYDAL
jgi:hypothetical protein